MRTEPDHNVRDYGAKGDGRATDTAAIQRAIDACSAAGGGRVLLPPGVYLSGTVRLASHIELHLMAGAVLKGSTLRSDYNPDDLFPENQRFCDVASVPEKVTGAHLVIAYRCENVSISGRGTIDGHSEAFFDIPASSAAPVYRRLEGECFAIRDWRPGQMVCLVGCRNVTVTDVTLLNSPYWTLVKIWNSFTQKSPVPGHGIRGLTLAGFRGRAVAASHLCGTRDYPLDDLRLCDWDISLRSEAGLLEMMDDDVPYPGLGYWGRQGSPVLPCALFARDVRDMALNDFSVRWEDPQPPWRYALMAERISGLSIRGGVWRQPQADRGSAIRCRACERVSVRGAVAASGTRAFLALEDMPATAATCVGNDLG